MLIKSDADLLDQALGYIYYYNNLREHSALGYKTPFSYLKAHLPNIDDKIRFVIPVILDRVAVELGPWSGYHVLAQHHAELVRWGNTLKHWREPILNHFDNHTTNGFTEGCNTKIKMLKRVSYGLKNVDVYWRKMLLGFVPSRSCFHTV
jgi:hypothetical protein